MLETILRFVLLIVIGFVVIFYYYSIERNRDKRFLQIIYFIR